MDKNSIVIDKTPEKRMLSPEKIEILRKMKVAAEYEKNGVDKMLIEQALSLRKQMLVDKIIANGGRMKRLGERMREAYEKGQSLRDLCIRCSHVMSCHGGAVMVLW